MVQIHLVGAGLFDEIGIVLLQAHGDCECAVRIALTSSETAHIMCAKRGELDPDSYQLTIRHNPPSETVRIANDQIDHIELFLQREDTDHILCARIRLLNGEKFAMPISDALFFSALAKVCMHMGEDEYCSVANPLESLPQEFPTTEESKVPRALH